MSQSLSKACSCSSPVNIWETSSLGPTILLAEYSRTSSNRRTKYLDVAKDAEEKSMMAKKDPHGKMGLKKHFIWTKFLMFILCDAKYKIWYKTAIASLFTGEWWVGGWVVSRWVVSPKSTHTRIFITHELGKVVYKKFHRSIGSRCSNCICAMEHRNLNSTPFTCFNNKYTQTIKALTAIRKLKNIKFKWRTTDKNVLVTVAFRPKTY